MAADIEKSSAHDGEPAGRPRHGRETGLGTGEYKDYKEFRDELRFELDDAADRFVKIGYLLRLARDTDILKESGYRNVNEFAREEFGLDKTLVSRFINITERFCDRQNPYRLEDRYKGYGYAKLAIMMQLPEGINEGLSPAYSKAEIQAIKEEVDAERAVTDLEVLMEDGERLQECCPEGSLHSLYQMMRRLCEDSPDLLRDLWGVSREPGGSRTAAMAEVLAPQGEAVHIARVPGTGRLSLMVRSADSDLSLVNIRTSEKERHTWTELAMCLNRMFEAGGSPEAAYEKLYGRPFPEKEEVAPVQPSAPEAKKPPEPSRKQGKVTRAKEAPAKKAPSKDGAQAGIEPEEREVEAVTAARPEPAPSTPETDAPEIPEGPIDTLAGAVLEAAETWPADLDGDTIYTINSFTTPHRLKAIWNAVDTVRQRPGWGATVRIHRR